MIILIPRNSTIPSKKHIFFIYSNKKVFIQVYERERQLTKNNHQKVNLILDGMPPMPRGPPHIEITYDLDVNSILNVTASEW